MKKRYGILCDYATGQSIRPATKPEWRASREAEAENIGGGTGVIRVGEKSVYVEGGQELDVEGGQELDAEYGQE